VQHGHVYLSDPVLVAERFQPVVQGLVPALLAPQVGAESGGLVELDMGPMAVDLHPVNGFGVLQRATVGHPIPVDVHRSRDTGRVLDERVRGGDQHDHRRQLRRLMQRREPLDHAGVTPTESGDRPVAPILRGRPGDDVNTVDPVVAIRREVSVGVAAASHIDPDSDITAFGERISP